jgi:serine/threonine protein phosphatase PrpC
VTNGGPPVEPAPTASTTTDPQRTAEPAASDNPVTTLTPIADPVVQTPSSVDAVGPQAETHLTVGPVRLVDPEPAPELTPAGDEPETTREPAVVTATASDPTNDPAPQTSPWAIPSPTGHGVAFCFNLAKLVGQGEDADPILHEARDLGLVAVFDGMGGAGGTTYRTTDGPRTGAYLASRAARDIVDRRMLELFPAENDPPGKVIAAQLHDDIEEALRNRLIDLQAPRSVLRSRLLRALPTTMAMAAVQRHQSGGDGWDCDLLWAGDSRVYLLRPGAGLAQLTTDDIREEGDAMANLRQDSVISNAMSADTDFLVNHRRVLLTTPFLIIAATDGCFGYLPSPMHFEWLLLSTLRTATDPEGWSAELQAQITAVSGDDSSMAVLGIGANHQQFQSLFADRTTDLEKRWVTPLDQLDIDIRNLERQLEVVHRRRALQTAELWAAYRFDYEHYLAAGVPKSSTS